MDCAWKDRTAKWGCYALAALVIATLTARGQQPDADKAEGDVATPMAYHFDVPLPITGKSLTRRVDQVLRKLPKADTRPILVFEFRPPTGTAGEGSGFGDSLDLARYLSGDELSRVHTVAWIVRTVKGHAVLPVLACEQIVMAKDAELGAAGISERTIDDTLRRAYTEIAERRRTVPAAIALGLLDKDLAVQKVSVEKQVQYVTPDGVAKLREKYGVVDESPFFHPGDEHLLSAQTVRHAPGFSILLADDRRALAAVLQVPLKSLQQDQTPEEGWKAIRVDLNGPVHRQAVTWIVRAIDEHQRRGDFSLLILYINSGGGDLDQSRRLAMHLAELGKGVRTVAYVDRQARGDASLIALACDDLVVHPEATIGGAGESVLTRDDLNAVRGMVPELFGQRGKDWSLPLALIDPGVEVYPYKHPVSGEVRYLCAEEAGGIEGIGDWQKGERPLETSRGLSGSKIEELGLAHGLAQNLGELRSQYRLEGELAQMRPNWALGVIEWLADPRIAGVLLFVGWFALMFEMSTPGASAPGFIAVLCFLLYFWSQFLHGTAGWLEILLFLGGLACLSLEIFVLPGFGLFGIGGALMVIVSIVLASQTFVVPTNAYQLQQFPISLMMVAAGMAGGIASIYVIRRFLPNTPYFNRMLLSPPAPEERLALSQREALVSLDHLRHKRGMAMTPLVPAGKVQFGDELVDCISNGELIAKGTPVLVEEVAGSRVVVRKVNL
jgi:membrane-bound serine protease (ClpP class)